MRFDSTKIADACAKADACATTAGMVAKKADAEKFKIEESDNKYTYTLKDTKGSIVGTYYSRAAAEKAKKVQEEIASRNN